MQIKGSASAGTMESGDILIEIEPGEKKEVEVVLKSSVANEFGKQIVKTIYSAVAAFGLEYAVVNAVDKGALDCTIRARVESAVYRSIGQSEGIPWGGAVRE